MADTASTKGADLRSAVTALGRVVGLDLGSTLGESANGTDTPQDGGARGQLVPPQATPRAAAAASPGELAGAAVLAKLRELETPPPSSVLAELRAAIGYSNPGARALELKHEREQQKALAREQAADRERARQLIREQLGDWSKDSATRLEQTRPQNPREEADAKRLGKHVWAIARQAATGSVRDLAYAIQQMMARAPAEAVGCWVVEAMGLNASGVALRQLYSQKARRKLVRSFVLWMAGSNTRLRNIAGSPSRRTVRGVKRVPQNLLARIAAVGGKQWSRSTTTRDCNEAHTAGLWRRVRLPRAIAHESEQCGASKQVVSRYWMELPRQPRRSSRMALPTPIGSFYTAGVTEDPLGWVAEQAKQAIVYAVRAVATVGRQLCEPVTVQGMLSPLLHVPP